MNKQLVMDYIISLMNLYGIVHKKKVTEIYNMQNNEHVDLAYLDDLLKEEPQELNDYFVEIYGDYFVSEAILEFDEFEIHLSHKKNKPYYIPDKKELLKYKDEFYFEVNEEYLALLNYLTINMFDGDRGKAEDICEDIKGICQFGYSVNNVFEEFNRRNINFESEEQLTEVMQLVTDLSNNTRIWENNGYTPDELFQKMKKSHQKELPKNRRKVSKKIGRNELCPCGSGNKYKKCCLLN